MPIATDSKLSYAHSNQEVTLPDLPIDNIYDCAFDPNEKLDDFLPYSRKQKYSKVAMTDGMTGAQYTYDEVAAQSSFLAYNLSSQYELHYGQRVLICMPTSPELVMVVLACQKLGLQMACCNDSYTPYELSHCVKLARPSKIITYSSMMERFGLPDKDLMIVADPTSSLWDTVEQAPKRHCADEEEICMLAFTSGTSGLPKLAMVSLKGFFNSLTNVIVSSGMFMNTEEQPRLLLCLPIFHGSGLMQALAGLMTGCHIVFCINKPFDMKALLQVGAKYQVQILTLVPALVNGLLMCGPMATAALVSLRYIAVGAAPLGPILEERLRAALPACTFITAYGMTEGLSPLTLSTSKDPLRLTGSVGRISPGCLIVLIDEQGNPVADGESGEVVAKHVTMAKGYFEDENATKLLFDKDGWMHTGDIGYFGANNNLFIVDRKKDLIKYNAMQVSPTEIEDVLQSHPNVKEAGVVGVRDIRKIGEQVPRAYVALKDDNVKDAQDDLASFVASRLSHYKHLRGGVRIMKALPRNGSGKLLRFELRKMAEAEHEGKGIQVST